MIHALSEAQVEIRGAGTVSFALSKYEKVRKYFEARQSVLVADAEPRHVRCAEPAEQLVQQHASSVFVLFTFLIFKALARLLGQKITAAWEVKSKF